MGTISAWISGAAIDCSGTQQAIHEQEARTTHSGSRTSKSRLAHTPVTVDQHMTIRETFDAYRQDPARLQRKQERKEQRRAERKAAKREKRKQEGRKAEGSSSNGQRHAQYSHGTLLQQELTCKVRFASADGSHMSKFTVRHRISSTSCSPAGVGITPFTLQATCGMNVPICTPQTSSTAVTSSDARSQEGTSVAGLLPLR